MDLQKKKKIIISICVSLLVIVLIIISFNIEDKEQKDTLTLSNDPDTIISNAKKENSSIGENEKKDFIQIDLSKYMEYYNGNEKKIVLLARPTCTYCQIAEPIIQNVSYEYNIEVNYLNTDNLTEEETNTLVHSNEFLENNFGTPILLIISNNDIIDKVDGLTDKAHYVEFFKKNNYIK